MYDINGQDPTCYLVNDFIMKPFVKEWKKATDGRKNDNRIGIIPAPPNTYNMKHNNDYGREKIA